MKDHERNLLIYTKQGLRVPCSFKQVESSFVEMMDFRCVVDIVMFLTFGTVINYVLIMNANSVWALLVVGPLWAMWTLNRAGCKSSQDKSVKWESGFTNWFIIVKTLTSLICVVLLNVFRMTGTSSQITHYTALGFMVVNVVEALIEDVQKGFYLNGACALLMLLAMPIYISHEVQQNLLATTQSGLYVFPFSVGWILLYTSWNACFSYGCNMSWMTRLVLIPPLIIAFLIDWRLWLGGRILMLLFHLLMRAIQCLWLYQPGNSPLTPTAGSIANDSSMAQVWGGINLLWSVAFLVLMK